MTFQIFKKFMLMGIFFLISTVSIHAQEPNMQALIGQSLSKLQQPTPENFLNCVAEMKRIDDMFPDSIQPKFQMVLQSLNFSGMNPYAPETENLMAVAEETIAKMEKMRNAMELTGRMQHYFLVLPVIMFALMVIRLYYVIWIVKYVEI